MKRFLLGCSLLAGLVQLTAQAAAQPAPPAMSVAPKIPNGATIPSQASVCWNYSTGAWQWCHAEGQGSGGGSTGTGSAAVPNNLVTNGNWTDVSFTATGTATVPTGLGVNASRAALRLTNLGTSTICISYTGTAAFSGSACSKGSIPIRSGDSFYDEPPGNVSGQAVSVIAMSGTDDVTAWSR